MFKVILDRDRSKVSPRVYTVYDVVRGELFPEFLMFIDNEWVYKSSLGYIPETTRYY